MASWGTSLLALTVICSFNPMIMANVSLEGSNDIDTSRPIPRNECTTICTCTNIPSISYCCPYGVPDNSKCVVDSSTSDEPVSDVSNPSQLCPLIFSRPLVCQLVSYPEAKVPAKTMNPHPAGDVCFANADCPAGEVCQEDHCRQQRDCVRETDEPTCRSDRECQVPDHCCITTGRCTSLNNCANSLFTGRGYIRVK